MARRPVVPGRLRRRLIVAFILVAGVAAGALGAGSYLLVAQARLQDSLQRAAADAPFQVTLSQQFLPLAAKRDEMLQSYESTGHHVIVVEGSRTTPSNPAFGPRVPAGLRARVASGDLAYERVRSGERHFLLVGGRIPTSSAELYVVTTEDRIDADLNQLRTVLLAGWVVVVTLAALIGRSLARRTLEPVGRASEAARSLAEGLLETRLPARAGDEFGAWATSFNQMAEALEAKITALSEAQARERRFTSDVAHELRTPVTALVAAASVLRDQLDELPDSARRPAELLADDVVRLRRLVEELMEISRFDAGKEAVRDEPVELGALVAAIVRSRGWRDEVRVVTFAPPGAPARQPDETGPPGEPTAPRISLVTDPRRLERVIANLVSNAVEYGGPEVTVTLERIGAHARIVVSDRGPGIAPEHLPHLFERFYKADPARASGGSGLGLAIVRENIRLLGGDVHVRSEVGFGTEFRLTLPVTRPLRDGEAPAVPGADSFRQQVTGGGVP